MRREFPHLFGTQKAPPGVNEPRSRDASQPKREKGVNDLPQAARIQAQDLVDRGLIPNLEAYSVKYWADQAKRAA
jgi:hypothetical protein